MTKEIIFIDGMSCLHCVKAVEDSVKSVNGVLNINVDLKEKKAEVEFSENITTIEKIIEAIEEEGYSVKK